MSSSIDARGELAGAIKALTGRGTDAYLTLKDGSGAVLWSGMLTKWTISSDHPLRVDLKDVAEHIAEEVSRYEDILRFKAEQLGVL